MVPGPHIDHPLELLPGKFALLTGRDNTFYDGRLAVIRVKAATAKIVKYDCDRSITHGFAVIIVGFAYQFSLDERFKISSKSAFIGYSTTTRWIVMMSVEHENELWLVPASGTEGTDWGTLVEVI